MDHLPALNPAAPLPGRPILASLAGYRPSWIKGDVAAGLAIAAVGLPTAIAYPAIAGLPPETGLYASIAPLVAYAVFGPSRQLIVGPDAATITVMAAVLPAMPGLEAADRPAVAAMLALIVGGLYIGGRALVLPDADADDPGRGDLDGAVSRQADYPSGRDAGDGR
jgi:MFS superfamily sulfate permease-like transporter